MPERLGEQLLDRSGVGIARRPADFLLALEDDQRALLLNVELLQQILLRIKIDREAGEVLEARLALEPRKYRQLRLAYRAPGSCHLHEDRLARRMRGVERLLVVRLINSRCRRPEGQGRTQHYDTEQITAIHRNSSFF